MAGRECADIVFCIDKSESMQPCFEGVKSSINQLIETFQSDRQRTWDVRLDYLAHAAGETSTGVAVAFESLKLPNSTYGDVSDAVYQQGRPVDAFFTSSVEEFINSLAAVQVKGDEATIIALDTAIDFPWRPACACHRVIVMLTDEPLETGVWVEKQQQQLDALVEKIHKKRVKLFIVAPQSDSFEALAMADRCEYEKLSSENDGLRKVDFKKMMAAIGKSVSQPNSQLQDGADDLMPLFGQRTWGTTSDDIGPDVRR